MIRDRMKPLERVSSLPRSGEVMDQYLKFDVGERVFYSALRSQLFRDKGMNDIKRIPVLSSAHTKHPSINSIDHQLSQSKTFSLH